MHKFNGSIFNVCLMKGEYKKEEEKDMSPSPLPYIIITVFNSFSLGWLA
jgi:hypothetical protein